MQKEFLPAEANIFLWLKFQAYLVTISCWLLGINQILLPPEILLGIRFPGAAMSEGGGGGWSEIEQNLMTW